MTIDIDLGVAFTDPSGLPTAPWGTGVTNPTGYRWTGRSLGDTGTLIRTWRDDTDRAGLFGNYPTVAVESGHKVAKFDGQGQMLNQTLLGTSQGSIGLVARAGAAGEGIVRFHEGASAAVGGVYVFTDGTIRIVRPGGTALNTGIVPGTSWFTVGIGLTDSAGAAVVVNGQSFPITDGSGGLIRQIQLGIYAGRSNLTGSVAEVVTWGARLTAAQLTGFHEAMTDHYAFI